MHLSCSPAVADYVGPRCPRCIMNHDSICQHASMALTMLYHEPWRSFVACTTGIPSASHKSVYLSWCIALTEYRGISYPDEAVSFRFPGDDIPSFPLCRRGGRKGPAGSVDCAYPCWALIISAGLALHDKTLFCAKIGLKASWT